MIVPNDRLSGRAVEIYPDSVYLQNAWMLAVLWLRNKSTVGYGIDTKQEKDPHPNVLDTPYIPPIMHTIVSLPDEQVIPGVVSIRRRK